MNDKQVSTSAEQVNTSNAAAGLFPQENKTPEAPKGTLADAFEKAYSKIEGKDKQAANPKENAAMSKRHFSIK
jgi:hypothetical protein